MIQSILFVDINEIEAFKNNGIIMNLICLDISFLVNKDNICKSIMLLVLLTTYYIILEGTVTSNLFLSINIENCIGRTHKQLKYNYGVLWHYLLWIQGLAIMCTNLELEENTVKLFLSPCHPLIVTECSKTGNNICEVLFPFVN